MIFKNKVVVITGGLGDIGKSIAEAFAREGAHIAICDLKSDAHGEAFAQELIRKFNTKCLYNQVDVARPEKVKAWLAAILNSLGPIEIVIANAAVVTPSSILEMKYEDWERDIRVNLSSVFYLTQEAAKIMIERKIAGRMLLIGSWAAHKVHEKMPAYSVAKAGLRMLCKCLALEFASKNILVNELAPGYVNAGLSAKIWDANPEIGQQSKERVPVKELITPVEIADQILLICDPKNKHMTGSTILMDGGLSLL